jgi:hypothetical protein
VHRFLCKYYTILHKELETLQILVVSGILEPIPHGFHGKTVILSKSEEVLPSFQDSKRLLTLHLEEMPQAFLPLNLLTNPL